MAIPNGISNGSTPFPSPKSELWRAFDPEKLKKADALPMVPGPPEKLLESNILERVRRYHASMGGRHLVFLDGYRVDAGSLGTPYAKAGGAAPLAWKDAVEENYFYEANARDSKDAAALVIPAGTKADDTITVWLAGSEAARDRKFHPRVSIWAQKGAACRVMFRSVPGAPCSFMNSVLVVRADEGAMVRIALLEDVAADAMAFTACRMDLGRGARVEHWEIMVGMGTAFSDMRVRLSGPGASVSLNGLSVLSDAARMHNHTVVTHAAPETASDQLFKDVLSGHARAEYSGLVHVTREAVKSRSNQLCRNLLLSGDARAHSRPKLQIDTDDVKCAHGSATGQLPPQELFYLRSRGLSTEQARAMLIRGFADEVVLTLPEEDLPLRKDLRAAVRRELERVVGLQPEEVLR